MLVTRAIRAHTPLDIFSAWDSLRCIALPSTAGVVLFAPGTVPSQRAVTSDLPTFSSQIRYEYNIYVLKMALRLRITTRSCKTFGCLSYMYCSRHHTPDRST